MSEQNLNVARVERVLQKLEQVRAANLSCFGSESHGFRLNPPLSAADLDTFETHHQIRLPDDYRAFLQHAGNGGAGPYYGIFPLDKCNDFAGWVLEEVPANFLRLPSPLFPGLPRSEGWDDGLGDVSPYQGTLSLGSQGCTYAMQLIVAGPFTGRVVYVDADNNPPYLVHEPDFLAWYERWLDELLQGYKIDWFGHGPGGGESDYFRILADPLASDTLKSEAAWAFRRLPRLSEVGARQIPNYLGHPIANVRSGALAAIQAFKLHDAAENAAQLLHDSSPEVRSQAIRTLMKLDPQQWAGAVLHRLHEDVDSQVASTAFFKLRKAEALPKPELLRILEQSPLAGLRSLAAYAVPWASEDLPLLIRLLSDSDSQVRHYALIGLRQLKDRRALPAVLELLAREKEALLISSIHKVLGEFGEPLAD